MKSSRLLWLGAACASAVLLVRAQSVQGVGDGAPTDGIKLAFQFGFTRGNFSSLAALPPVGPVRKLGTTGLVQEFAGASDSSARYALVRASSSDSAAESQAEVRQVYAPMYAYYLETGAGVAGYPTTDTQVCAAVLGTCQWQSFDKNHALFVLLNRPAPNTFLTRDPFFTKWAGQGGLNSFGPAVSGEETITSGAKTAATAIRQAFSQGEIFSITGGQHTGRILSVRQPVYSIYAAAENGGALGFLGFPTSEETVVAGGRRRQTFEGGAIEYLQGADPVVILPVASVLLSSSTDTLRMKLGDTSEVTAATYAANGARLLSRAVAWNTSNARVVAIEARGDAVTLRAAGGGSATITATSEGKVSRALAVFVTAPCCQPGEGAPTAVVQQAFQDALVRTRIQVKLPASATVRRIGQGYTQEFTSPDGSIRYVFAKPDTLGPAFLMSGPILARHASSGGFAGALGYPVADPVNNLRQIFQGGALAGSPVQMVSNPILARWAALNYEATAGLPAGPSEPVLSFTATAGQAQAFSNGVLVNAASGAYAGRVFFVSGAILAKFIETGGVAGKLGFPVSDEGASAGKRRQEFEGGAIESQNGVAEVIEKNRTPQISANPSNVAAGSRVRIAAGGFPASSTLRISVSGRPDFTVATPSGAYAWEMLVPISTPGSLITLRAVEVNGRAVAVGSFVVQAASETLLKLTKVRGDQQTGLPGARLPQPFRIRLADEFGAPVAGASVQFSASPGARIEMATAATNAEGEAEAWLRMPPAESAALATAQAGGQVVTFQARSVASTLTNFPRFTQGGNNSPLGAGPETIAQKGALLVSAASALRHLQNTGRVASVNGPADPELLNSFLKEYCAFDSQGGQICDGFLSFPATDRNLNLWRLEGFTGGSLSIVPLPAGHDSIRDALAQGAPVLLALALTANGKPAGAHFVTAIGVAASGAIVLHDPNPRFARNALEEYASGFTAGASSRTGTLSAALRIEPQASSAAPFLLMGPGADFEISSLAGRCGETISWPGFTSDGTGMPTAAPVPIRFRSCDGQDEFYQLDLTTSSGQQPVFVDLGNPGGRSALSPTPASYRVTRPGQSWIADPLTLTLSASSIVNAASFRPEIAPGTIISIFGGGLARAGGETQVEIGGRQATVLAAYPFQVNATIPSDLPIGTHSLVVVSPFGRQELMIELQGAAPAVFVLTANQPALTNQDGALNSPSRPERRGRAVIAYGTGFGATVRRGTLDLVAATVQAFIAGREIPVGYAGLAPGYSGLYQINLILPEDLAPGTGLALIFRVDGVDTLAVPVSIQ